MLATTDPIECPGLNYTSYYVRWWLSLLYPSIVPVLPWWLQVYPTMHIHHRSQSYTLSARGNSSQSSSTSSSKHNHHHHHNPTQAKTMSQPSSAMLHCIAIFIQSWSLWRYTTAHSPHPLVLWPHLGAIIARSPSHLPWPCPSIHPPIHRAQPATTN